MVDLGAMLGRTAISDMMSRSEFGEEDSTDVWFENYTENIHARVVNIKLDYTSFAGSTLIWGNASFGIWGSFYWGNTGEASFILGNSTAGKLGINLLGTNESTPVRYKEQCMWTDYDEYFDSTTYKDSTNTTAVGWGTGSVVFVSNQTTIDFTNGSQTSTVAVNSGSIQLS